MKTKIRKATPKDIEQMLKIIKQNSPSYPRAVAKKEIEEMFSKALHKPAYLVVEKDKEIVAFGGFIRSWIDNMIFNIFWINTNPKHKNLGFGTKLIEALIKEIKSIKEKPKAKIILISTKIPSYYEKFGFIEINDKYDGDYVLMEMKIK